MPVEELRGVFTETREEGVPWMVGCRYPQAPHELAGQLDRVMGGWCMDILSKTMVDSFICQSSFQMKRGLSLSAGPIISIFVFRILQSSSVAVELLYIYKQPD